MKVIVRQNNGLVSFLYGKRPATNEERYEGLMRSTQISGTKRTLEALVICETLRK